MKLCNAEWNCVVLIGTKGVGDSTTGAALNHAACMVVTFFDGESLTDFLLDASCLDLIVLLFTFALPRSLTASSHLRSLSLVRTHFMIPTPPMESCVKRMVA